jgi:hypothetical protein
VDDLKVGDLVRYKAPWSGLVKPDHGLVTKIHAREADPARLPQVTVFWFATGQSTSPPEGSLIKVEVRGE